MGQTLHLIAQANTNEILTGLYGNPGDQTGCELNSRKWYSYPWDHIYRAKNEEDREFIAKFMESAILNGFIGYDNNRNKRDTLFKLLMSNGYDITEVATPCYCDCSALGFCAIYPITGVSFSHPDPDVILCPKVRHYEEYMLLDGVVEHFDKLEGPEYTDSEENLLRGDILVALGHHIAIYI